MDTKSLKCVHLVEGGNNGPQYVNMAPMGKTSLGHVTHARKRQKTSFTNLETHGDGCGYLACDTCSSGVSKEIVPAGIVPIWSGTTLGFKRAPRVHVESMKICNVWILELSCRTPSAHAHMHTKTNL